MEKIEFDTKLKQAGFNTKKSFAEFIGLNSKSVNNWGVSQNIPYWVESWLDNYIELNNAKKKVISMALSEDKQLAAHERVLKNGLVGGELSELIDLLTMIERKNIKKKCPDFHKEDLKPGIIEISENMVNSFTKYAEDVISNSSSHIPENNPDKNVLDQIQKRLETLEKIVKK